MKKLNNFTGSLLFCLIFGGSAVSVCGQTNKLTLIYDGRDAIKEAVSSATEAEKKLIEKEVLKKEAVIKGKTELECDENEFDVLGAASGSFTKATASQKVFLYELCRSARTFGIGGIVVVEDGKIVAHYTYGENGLYADIAFVSDINQNGLSEILLIAVGMGQGYTLGAVEIIEITSGGIESFGIADVYSDDYGNVSAKTSATAYKVSAQTGKTPVYFRETYSQKNEEAKWTLVKKSQKFSLRKDYTPKYNKIL